MRSGGSQQIPPTVNTGSVTAADSTVGTHTFTVNAQDQVGNVSPASPVTYTVSKASTTTTITPDLPARSVRASRLQSA